MIFRNFLENKYMNYLVPIFLFHFILSSCMFSDTTKKIRNFELTCSNDYTIAFSEKITSKNGDTLSEIFVTVKNPNSSKKFLLKQAVSASGVRYVTEDQKYVFWEHQGEFTWNYMDSLICECK